HLERMRRVKAVARRLDRPVAVLVDLQGPEIRTDFLNGEESFNAVPDDKITFTCDKQLASHQTKTIYVPEKFIQALQPDNSILIDDGKGEFIVSEKNMTCLFAHVTEPLVVKRRKTLNTPSVMIDLPSLIEKDLLYIDAARNDLVDYVALSFVRNAHDIEMLRAELTKRKLEAAIVAKIENQSAIDHLDEIITASDAIMVARGDLGVEIPYQELAHWQKLIIQKSRQLAKPVITATQMLQSMINSPRPSRAEVTDVANAVYDGTDAVMLSDETTIGQYAVKAVETQTNIALYTEKFANPPQIEPVDTDIATLITHAAMGLLASAKGNTALHIDKIVCLTQTGLTARLLSQYRQSPIIYALTPSEQTYNRLSLVYGIEPVVATFDADAITHEKIVEKIVALAIARSGETILLVHGGNWGLPGMTDTIKIIQIP
ncbi:pyruvate kinase, partial [Candidatus Woesebacteria bacterium]|nr:pyruvate kinase [Candidatus Woesebacteria bacterium]